MVFLLLFLAFLQLAMIFDLIDWGIVSLVKFVDVTALLGNFGVIELVVSNLEFRELVVD